MDRENPRKAEFALSRISNSADGGFIWWINEDKDEINQSLEPVLRVF